MASPDAIDFGVAANFIQSLTDAERERLRADLIRAVRVPTGAGSASKSTPTQGLLGRLMDYLRPTSRSEELGYAQVVLGALALLNTQQPPSPPSIVVSVVEHPGGDEEGKPIRTSPEDESTTGSSSLTEGQKRAERPRRMKASVEERQRIEELIASMSPETRAAAEALLTLIVNEPTPK